MQYCCKRTRIKNDRSLHAVLLTYALELSFLNMKLISSMKVKLHGLSS
jgi:hypothetical protein